MGNLVTCPRVDINTFDPASPSMGELVNVVRTPRQRLKRSDVYLPRWVRENGAETTESQPASL
jgi:hypothetical protein